MFKIKILLKDHDRVVNNRIFVFHACTRLKSGVHEDEEENMRY